VDVQKEAVCDGEELWDHRWKWRENSGGKRCQKEIDREGGVTNQVEWAEWCTGFQSRFLIARAVEKTMEGGFWCRAVWAIDGRSRDTVDAGRPSVGVLVKAGTTSAEFEAGRSNSAWVVDEIFRSVWV
jgi:hypothetical protein